MKQVEIHKSNPKQLGLSMWKSIYLRAMIQNRTKSPSEVFFFFLSRKMIGFFVAKRD